MQDKTKQFLVSVPLLVIGVGAIGFVTTNIIKEHNRTQKIDVEIARQQEIAARISRENNVLTKTITYLSSEEAQKFSAQKLGYQEEGQSVASVKDIAKAEENLEAELASARDQDSDELDDDQKIVHWKVWWDIFFGKS